MSLNTSWNILKNFGLIRPPAYLMMNQTEKDFMTPVNERLN